MITDELEAYKSAIPAAENDQLELEDMWDGTLLFEVFKGYMLFLVFWGRYILSSKMSA